MTSKYSKKGAEYFSWMVKIIVNLTHTHTHTHTNTPKNLENMNKVCKLH